MKLVSLAVATALASGLVGQVPYRHLLVSEGGGLSTRPLALTVIEPVSRNQTPLRTTTIAPSQMTGTIALDPADNGALYVNPGITAIGNLGVQKLTIQGSKLVARSTPAIQSAVGFGTRFLVHGGFLYYTSNSTAATGGLWRAPVTGGQGVQIGTLPSATDVAVFANRAYVNSYAAAATTSSLLEVDLTSLTARLVTTSLPPTQALGVFGGGLMGGGQNGDLLLINTATGQSAVFMSPNKGPIMALTQDPLGAPPLFATTSRQVWSIADLQTPLYTALVPINDIDYGTQNQAWMMSYGTGCPGTNQRPAQFTWAGIPSVNNPAFALNTMDGRPTSPAVMLLGAGRLDVDLSVFGMPTCKLLMNPLFNFGFVINASGIGILPLPIPNNPTLVGLVLQAQQANLDAGANANGVVMSDAAELGVR